MEPVSPKNYDIDHNWSSWCRLPSFASIRKYQTTAARLRDEGKIQVQRRDLLAHTCEICLQQGYIHAAIYPCNHHVCRYCYSTITMLTYGDDDAALSMIPNDTITMA